jgi:ABC-type branched-subunit amino acid transport system substrate-binding protein
MRLGILAAFHKANKERTLRPYVLQLKDLDDGYEVSNATENMMQFILQDHVFGVIGSGGRKTAEALVDIASEYKVPFIGALSGAKFLRWPFKEEVINIRASYIDETAMMVKYLTEDLAFTKVSMFLQDDDYGEAGLEGVDIALRAHGLTVFSQGKFKYLYGTGEEDVETGLNNIGAAGDPEGCVAFGYYTPVAKFIKLAKARWPELYIMLVSRIGPDKVASLLNTTESRKNIYISQVVPSPYDEIMSVSAEYHEAIKDYLVYAKAVDKYTYDFTSHYDYKSIEGYIVGRFTVEVLKNMDIYARSEFKKYVFETQTFSVSSGIVLGPYSYPPNYDASDKDADYGYTGCNQGGRQVWLTHLQEDGSYEYMDELAFADSCGLASRSCIEGYTRNSQEETCQPIVENVTKFPIRGTLMTVLVFLLWICIFCSCTLSWVLRLKWQSKS